jgi:hypothetical protein
VKSNILSILPSNRIARLVASLVVLGALGIASYAGAAYINKPPSTSYAAIPDQVQTTPDSGAADISCPSDRPASSLNIGGQQLQICGKSTEGTVKATTSDSITVAASDSSGDTTFTIGSDSALTEHGGIITMDDIHVGDPISVLPSDKDANHAKRILLNFSINKGPGA